MKRALIAGLLIGGAAPLPAQPLHNYCDPRSGWYSADACNIQMLYELRRDSRAGIMRGMKDRESRWAEVEAKYPPVIVNSRPGHRLAPKRLASQSQGGDAKKVEAALEALLEEFERVARADPKVLLSLPYNDLATANTWLMVRSYMVLRGLNDVSPELVVRVEYMNWREDLRAEMNAKFLTDPGAVQFEYERVLIATMQLNAQWMAALASGNPAAKSAVQKTAEQHLQSFFRDSAFLKVRVGNMDAREKLDLSARRDNMCPWGERVTLLIKPAAARTEGDSAVQGQLMTPGASLAPSPRGGWGQFDFRESEDFEYQVEGMDGARRITGTIRIGVRAGADGKGTLSIAASIDGETLDQVVGYNLAEGLPLISSLPWAQTGLGQILALSLLHPRPDLTAEALTSGLDWRTPDGSMRIKTVALGPCSQGPRLSGRLVSTVVTQAAAANPPMVSCVGLDVPLPIMQKFAWAGGGIEFKMTNRTPARIPDLAGKPR